MAFCDFCNTTCTMCQVGERGAFHAHTADGKWVCDTCWLYDLCTSDENPYGVPRNPSGPCEKGDCPHRPKIDGPWVEWEPAGT